MKLDKLVKEVSNTYNFDIASRVVEVDNIITLDIRGNMLVNKTMKLFKETMLGYGTIINQQQEEFALKTAKLIFGQLQNGKVNLVSAKCGFGKSVLIKCAMKILTDNLTTGFSIHHNEGAIIVTDKIEKLEEFKEFIDGTLENKEGHKAYLLKYTEKTVYETDEDYYSGIYLQRKEQSNYPILLLSSQRLSVLNEKIEQYDTWNIKEKEYNRTVKIIDEKPEMFDMMDIDNNFMNIIIDAIENIKIKDKEKDKINKNYLRKEIQSISYTITELSNNMSEKQFDIYCAVEGSTLTKNDTKFFELCNTYLSEYINIKISYIVKLLIDEGGLFCNSIDNLGKNKRYFRTIGLKKIHTNVKTIIFDATSHYDMSYCDFEKYQYININDEREFNNLNIHNIPVNMAKWAVTENGCKKLITCSEYLKNRFSNTKDIFLVTYKSIKYILDKQLGNGLNLVKHKNEIPSFGSTKGKNTWNKCSNMIHLGFNRMREIEYISRYISILVDEDKKDFFKNISELKNKDNLLKKFAIKRGEFISENLQKYMILSLLIDFEQEIFRTKIRDFTDTTTPVHIYVFNMYKSMINRVEKRFNIKVIQEVEPIEFIDAIAINRGESSNNLKKRKEKEDKTGKKVKPQKRSIFIKWISEEYDGTKTTFNNIYEKFDITKKNLNDYLKNETVIHMIEDKGIEVLKEGREKYMIIK